MKNLALFSYGFRPFFLLAALFAVVAVFTWLVTLISGVWPETYLHPQLWHGHEMLFGFVGAAISGFLLTAVPGWTGQPVIAGRPLFGLVCLWLGGRLVLAFQGHLPPLFTAIVDLAFFPVLVAMLMPSLLKGKLHNMIFPVFLTVLFVANLVFHVAVAGNDTALASNGLLLGVNTVLLIISIIGGRIVPAFTQGAVRRTDATFTINPLPLLDRAAVLSVFLILLVDIVWPFSTAAGWLAAIAALIHLLRFARWKIQRSLSEPIVLILHVAYAWLIIGLALKGLFLLTGVMFSAAWLHALTTGTFATMILAVMTRAALGHTGRPLIAPPPIVAAYILITLAALVRVTGPVFPDSYIQAIAVSGILWIGAFTLFLIVYTPILIRPRADGKPG